MPVCPSPPANARSFCAAAIASSRRAVGTPSSSLASTAFTFTTSGSASSARRSRSPSASSATRTPAARASATTDRYPSGGAPRGTDPLIVSHPPGSHTLAVASTSSTQPATGTSEPCS